MSTSLPSRSEGIFLTRFFGGAGRGTCIQITQQTPEDSGQSDSFQLLQLDRIQAADLAVDLIDFATKRSDKVTY